MTAPIALDPSALARTGATVTGEGDAAAAAVRTLSSALSGSGAPFGHDAAGLVFGQSYTESGDALMHAAGSAVSACRKIGFGVQMSASNYAKANAASTVGGGDVGVPTPTAPAAFEAPHMPPALGGGIAAPLGWALVESFVGDVWPDGDPAEMRAAAAAWRTFGTAMSAAAGPMGAAGAALGGEQIPEAGQMASAAGEVGTGFTEIGTQAETLAGQVEAFAADVEATQNAIRGLLQQLSPSGLLDAIGGLLTGHNPWDEVKKVAAEIKTVLNNMKREADASRQMFSQAINLMDSATTSLEGWAHKEFVEVFGQDVGNVLSQDFTAALDLSEGGAKFVAQTVEGLAEFDPTRFAYDPEGAAKTWGGLLEAAQLATNPAALAEKVISDPQGSLDTVKGLVDWEDVEDGHPFRALGYNAAQVGTLFIPGAGEAAPAVDAASAEARVAGAEARVAGAGTRDAAVAGAREASALDGVAARSGQLSSKLDGLTVPEAKPGAASGGRAPVPEAPRVPESSRGAEGPAARGPEVPAGRAPVEAPDGHGSVEVPKTEAAPHAPVDAPRAEAAAPHAAAEAPRDPPAAQAVEPPVPSAEAPVQVEGQAAGRAGQAEAEAAAHAPSPVMSAPANEFASAAPHATTTEALDPRIPEGVVDHGGVSKSVEPEHSHVSNLDHGAAPDNPHNPPHTALHDPPDNHGLPGGHLPDLRELNNEFRLPDGSVDPERFDEWTERVADAYPQISPDGVAGVYDYTTENYQGMNPYLRDMDPLAPHQQSILGAESIDSMSDAQRSLWESRISSTDDGLASLPPYRADPADTVSTTYRGMQASDELLTQLHVGGVFHDPGYLSTSLDPHIARYFSYGVEADHVPTLFVVEGHNGVDVSSLSRYVDESEIVFPRGSDFEVVSRDVGPDGVLRIVLRQVLP